MVNILFFENPFEPQTHKSFQHVGGVTVREWLRLHFGGSFREFSRPTVAILNSQPLMRDEWETWELSPGDVLIFTTLPGYTAVAIAIVVGVVVAVAVALLMPVPALPGQQAQPDPTYTLKGQTNQLRLMDPIEVPYGRCRIWPSYAARPFNLYQGNEQFQFSLFCLGQGEFDVSDVMIEDTPIENFQEADFEIIPPGGEMTMFPDNVVTSTEVGGIELFGPNRAEYPTPDGWSGPFVANASGTLANRLELDIAFPQGIYRTREGSVKTLTVELELQYREIDDSGAAVGSWTSFGSFIQTMKTNTPQRFTVGLDVDAGRYEVRARRTTEQRESIKYVSTCQWEALRAFLPQTKNFGDVTLLAVKIQASNNLNDQNRSRVNVFATRKLPIYDAGSNTWSAPTATRNPVWAFCDLFRSQYGGRLADEYLDLDSLATLAAYYETAGKTFDWIFDQRITVWEAAKTVARIGRAIPMLFGSQVGMVRDQAKTIPTAIFTPDCMLKGSFKQEIKLFEPDSVDHVIAEYVDPNTWKPETVNCGLEDSEFENGENVKLSGCTDRTQAFREGLYIMAGKHFWRRQVSFKTGLEGHIPAYGDLVQISHDVPRWNQSGQIDALATHASGMTVAGVTAPATLAGYVPHLGADPLEPLAPYFTTDPDKFPQTQIFWDADRWKVLHLVSAGYGVTFESATGTIGSLPTPVSATGWTAGTSLGGHAAPTGAPVITAQAVHRRATISNAVAWDQDMTCTLFVRDRLGAAVGPLDILPGPDSLSIDIVETFEVSAIELGENCQPPIFLFGINGIGIGLYQITGIQPDGNETVEITATNYAAEVHEFDTATPPAASGATTPPANDNLPTIRGLTVSTPAGTNGIYPLIASWIPTPGAVHYLVETSGDGVTWTPRGQVTVPNYSENVVVADEDFYFRVAAVRTSAGPWETWNGPIGIATSVPPAMTGLQLSAAFTGTSVAVQWQPFAGTGEVTIRVYKTGGVLLREDYPESESFTYTIANMNADSGTPSRNLTFELLAINSAGESSPITLDVTNDPPAALAGLGSVYTSADATHKKFTVSWTASGATDLDVYRVWASATAGFTPGSGNLVYEGVLASYLLSVPKELDGSTLAHYWRAAALDVWGEECNMSAQQTIAATAP